MFLGTLTARLTLDTRHFQQTMLKAEHRLKRMAVGMRTLSRDMANAGMRLGAFVTLPIVGLGTAMVKAASDAEETAQKFDVVFSGMGARANEVTKSLAKNWDLSAQAAQEYMAQVASAAQGRGHNKAESLGIAKSVVELSADITSFMNLSDGVGGAVKRMISGMAGNSRAMRELMVVYTQGEEKFEALKKNLMETQGLTSTQARALAVLTFAFNQSKNALGDYSRTAGTFANRLRALGEAFKDFKVTIGKFLTIILELPKKLNTLTKALNRLGAWFTRIPDSLRRFIVYGLMLAAALAPLLVGLSMITFSLTALLTTLKAVFMVMRGLAMLASFVASPLGVLLVAVLALAVAFDRMYQNTRSLNSVVAHGMVSRVKSFARQIVKAIIKITPYIVGFFANFSKNVNTLTGWVREKWSDMWHDIKEITVFGLETITFAFGAWVGGGGPKKLFWGLLEGFLNVMVKIGTAVRDFLKNLDEFFGASNLVSEVMLVFDHLYDRTKLWLAKWVDIGAVYAKRFWDNLNLFGSKSTVDIDTARISKRYNADVKKLNRDFNTRYNALVDANGKSGLENLIDKLKVALKGGEQLGKDTGMGFVAALKAYLEDKMPELAAKLRTDTMPNLDFRMGNAGGLAIAGRRGARGLPPLSGGGLSRAGVAPAAMFGSMDAFKISNNAKDVQKKIERNTAQIERGTRKMIQLHQTELNRPNYIIVRF